MNVDHIYQLQRDDAFAKQFAAEQYRTFVAMPFSNRGGYPQARIRSLLVDKVHARANDILAPAPGRRCFAPLHRVDDDAAGAVVITDEIINGILDSHFFVGDLTGANFGVVLETGIALALKPNRRVVLFTQDESAPLHFDLRVTNVNRYDEGSLVENAARALASAAEAFEDEGDRYSCSELRALARIAHVEKDEEAHGRFVAGVEFLTLRFRQIRGTFVSAEV